MQRLIQILMISLLVAVSATLVGCMNAKTAGVKDDQQLIQSGQAKCVLVKDGRIIAVENGRGVSPLLALYESHQSQMAGATVVDKVVGRAAAAIAICGNVSHVHGELMSEDAITFLAQNGITSSYTQLVPRILNQKLDGLCPLEQSVQGIEDPQAALAALRARITELSANVSANMP